MKHVFKPAPVAARCLRTSASLKHNEVHQEQPWLWCLAFERQHTFDIGPVTMVLIGLHKPASLRNDFSLGKPFKAIVV